MYDFLLIANSLVWLALVIFYVRQPCASAFHPVSAYLLFHFIVFVFRPIIAWVEDYREIYRVYRFTPSMEDKVVVQLSWHVRPPPCFTFTTTAAGGRT